MYYSSLGVTENFLSNFGINIKTWVLVIIIRNRFYASTSSTRPEKAEAGFEQHALKGQKLLAQGGH